MPDNQKKSPLLAPSLLAADFSIIKEEVMSVQQGGADWIHLYVMDGHFVPNLSFGPQRSCKGSFA